jgi:hypothetical protein
LTFQPSFFENQTSVAFWARSNSTLGSSAKITFFDFANGIAASENANYSYSMYLQSNNIRAKISYGASGTATDDIIMYTDSNILTDNVWRHYAWTIDNTYTWRLYINSVLVFTKSSGFNRGLPIDYAPPAINYTTCFIGRDAGSWQSASFSGAIDEFRWYQRSIGQSEISNLYAAQTSVGKFQNPSGSSPTWISKPGIAVDATETLYTIKNNEIALIPGANSTYAIWTSPKTTNIKIDVSFADYHSRSTSGVGFQMFKINADNTFGSTIFPRTVTSVALTNANPTNYLNVPSRTISVATGDKVVYRIDANGNVTSASSVLATNIYVDPNPDLKQYKYLQAHLGNNLTATSFVAGNANVVNDTLRTGNWNFYVAGNTSVAAITGASGSSGEWTVGNLLSYSSGSSPILNYSFDPSTKSGSTIKNLATNDYGLTLTNGATIKPRNFYSTQTGELYIINGQTNPTLTFHRGYTYIINVSHPNYPMFIQTVPSPYSSGNVYNTGVTNNGIGSGLITIVVTNDTPSTLYYVSSGSTTTTGTINIVASGEPDTVLSMNVSSGQHATSSAPLSFSQPWTISFVYQFTGTFNGSPTVFEIGNANGFGLRISGNSGTRSIESYQNGSLFSSQSYANSNNSAYNHYALVYNNGSFTGYFNATTSATFQGSPQLNVVSDFTYMNFGKSNMSSVTNPTTGTRVIEIDNFQIFNGALSLSDITALSNGTYVAPPPTLNDSTTGATWMPIPGTPVDSSETNYTVKSAPTPCGLPRNPPI